MVLLATKVEMDQKKIDVYNNYVEFVNDYLNAEDDSVGIYFTTQMTADLVNEIKNDIFYGIEILFWDDKTLVIKDSSYIFAIKLIDVTDCSFWTVINI